MWSPDHPHQPCREACKKYRISAAAPRVLGQIPRINKILRVTGGLLMFEKLRGGDPSCPGLCARPSVDVGFPGVGIIPVVHGETEAQRGELSCPWTHSGVVGLEVPPRCFQLQTWAFSIRPRGHPAFVSTWVQSTQQVASRYSGSLRAPT